MLLRERYETEDHHCPGGGTHRAGITPVLSVLCGKQCSAWTTAACPIERFHPELAEALACCRVWDRDASFWVWSRAGTARGLSRALLTTGMKSGAQRIRDIGCRRMGVSPGAVARYCTRTVTTSWAWTRKCMERPSVLSACVLSSTPLHRFADLMPARTNLSDAVVSRPPVS
jgi:hypothetical protein